MRRLLGVLLLFSVAIKSGAVELSISLDSTGAAECCVTGEVHGRLVVQQFRWNKWVNMKWFGSEQIWKDTCAGTTLMLHSGQNQFRLAVVPTNPYQDTLFSYVAKVGSSAQPGNCGFARVCGPSDRFTLKAASYWEIYNQFGVMVKSGTSVDIPVGDLPKGGYFLNYDNCTAEFFKQ